MKWFISTHRIREDAIPTWMGATTKAEHEGIEFLGLVPDIEKVATGKTPRYTNGKRNKGIRGSDLVLSELPATLDDLKTVFASKGFSAESASPCVSSMVSEGKIERGKDKVYRKKAA